MTDRGSDDLISVGGDEAARHPEADPLLCLAVLDPMPARLSGDPGPPPTVCQWLAGDGPFRERDKCGAPTVPGRPYCVRHLARAYLVVVDEAALRSRQSEGAAPAKPTLPPTLTLPHKGGGKRAPSRKL